MDDLIFHSALPLVQERVSGSTVRPRKMLQAFQELGIHVRVCAGTSAERRAIWRDVFRSKRDYLGVYSELATTPIALTDPDHFPRAMTLDCQAFQSSRARGWPVSVFYRDVYWRFPKYRTQTAFWKRAVAYPFFHLELHQLRRSVDHLFLPSVAMLDQLPGGFPSERVSALPPGGTGLDGRNDRDRTVPTGALQLLYVGGIVPPLYDLTGMLDAVDRLEGVTLIVCCREDEWKRWRSTYKRVPGLEIVHASGAALDSLYRSADICLMVLPPTDYWRLTVQVKLFEALGAGLPIIASTHSGAGRFVCEEKVGWTVHSTEELTALLARLLREPSDVAAVRHRVAEVRKQHTWNVRAKQVLRTLESYRPPR